MSALKRTGCKTEVDREKKGGRMTESVAKTGCKAGDRLRGICK